MGVPDPQVHLPPQQHVLLLLRVLDGVDSGGEVHGGVSPRPLQGHVRLNLGQAKVKRSKGSPTNFLLELFGKEIRQLFILLGGFLILFCNILL